MDNEVKLSPIEDEELRAGQELYEMTQTPGFRRLEEKLKDAAFHSWVDPREIEGPEPEKQLVFRYLNGFYAANNAKEVLEWIAKQISASQYLEKKKSGEIRNRSMKIS